MHYFTLRGVMKDNGFSIRMHMVRLARRESISEVARQAKTSRKTVRKWVERYKKEGAAGLKDRSRAPKKRPKKISSRLEEKIRELRKKYRWGPQRLKDQCGLPCSDGAIYRVIKQAGLIQPRKPKWKRKRDLRKQKEKLKPFEKIQIDVKDLSDIPEYWTEGRGNGLPRYEFTAREVRTGATFVAFARANDGNTAAAFATYLLEHLKNYGVDLENLRAQTDNGSEFIGSITKKQPTLSAFEQVLKNYHVHHERIPPRCSTWNSDVETFHRTVEDELFSVEPLRTPRELLAKAYAYQIFYNQFRKNRWRGNLAPREILDSVGTDRYDPGLLSLPPLLLDSFLAAPLPGNDVPTSPTWHGIRY